MFAMTTNGIQVIESQQSTTAILIDSEQSTTAFSIDFTTESDDTSVTPSTSKWAMITPPVSLASQIVVVVFIAVVGLIGNGLIILIYGKKLFTEKTGSNLLIVVLAFVDLLATTVCLPLSLVAVLGLMSPGVMMTYAVLVAFTLLGSLNLLLAMSIDRFVALYRPHQYQYGYRRTKYGLVIVFVWVLVVSTAFLYLKPGFRELGTAATYVPMSLTVLLYITIFLGLYVRNRNKVSPVPSGSSTSAMARGTEMSPMAKQVKQSIGLQQHLTVAATRETPSTSDGTQSTIMSLKSRQRLTRTAKMFCIITVVFILAYIPFNFINFEIISFPSGNIFKYTYYLNSISNFFIYFYFNSAFRKSVLKFIKTRRAVL